MSKKVKDITQIASNDEKKSGNLLKDGLTRPIGRVGEFTTNFVTEDLKEQFTKDKDQAGNLTAVGVFRATLQKKEIGHLSWIADLLQFFAGLAFDVLDKTLKLLNLVDEKLLGGTINKIFGAEKEAKKEEEKKKTTTSPVVNITTNPLQQTTTEEAEKKAKEETKKLVGDSLSDSTTNPDNPTNPIVGTHTAKVLEQKNRDAGKSNSV